MKWLSVCLVVALPSCVFAQGLAPASHLPGPYVISPSAPVDVSVSCEPLDSAARAFGLTISDVNDILRLSVESTGWDLAAGADLAIAVKLTSLPQRQEDLFTFQIDVAAGGASRPLQEGTGGLSSTTIADVPLGGSAKLLAEINQQVSKVSRRFRQDVMKRSFMTNPRRTVRGIYEPYPSPLDAGDH